MLLPNEHKNTPENDRKSVKALCVCVRARACVCVCGSLFYMGDMQQLPYWVPTNIRGHRTQFSLSRDQAPGICAPLSSAA
jgi:hypothetical protein